MPGRHNRKPLPLYCRPPCALHWKEGHASLPNPGVVLAYEQAQPGLARRIVSMVECEQRERHHANRLRLRADILLEWARLVSALIVVLAVLGAAVFLISRGHSLAGTFLGTVELVGLGGVFIHGSRDRVERLPIRTGADE